MKVSIMSGVPGSGKSHHVREMAKIWLSEGKRGTVVSTDFFWYSNIHTMDVYFDELSHKDFGEYKFEIPRLAEAHPACMAAFIDILKNQEDRDHADYHVIVDNTCIHNWEINPYYLVAQSFGADVEILRVEANLDDCIARQTHNVPEHVLLKMNMTFHEEQDHPWEAGVKIPAQHMPWWTSRNVG